MDRKYAPRRPVYDPPSYESTLQPPSYDDWYSANNILDRRVEANSFARTNSLGALAGEAAINRARINRETNDFWHAFDTERVGNVLDENLPPVEAVNESKKEKYEIPNQIPTEEKSTSSADISETIIPQTRGAPGKTQHQGRFYPLLAGILIGATVGTISHLALTGANTAGASAVADHYHALHNVAFNNYMTTQSDPSIGASYAGHYNYASQLAYINDQKEHAAPWMTWGEHAALNHFTTTNEYQTIRPQHWSGYIYHQTQNDDNK